MFPLCKVCGLLYYLGGRRLIPHRTKDRICRYTEPTDRPSTDTYQGVTQIDGFPQKISFPSVYFLDHDVFQQTLVEIPNPAFPLPLQLTALLENDSEVHHIASRFFDHIHLFMPIISKRQFYERHLSPLVAPKPDVLLLCLCMKIFAWVPSRNANDPQTPDYLSAKKLIVEIETAGVLTLQLLQASLLVAIYELGHGIYPSCHITIGACATRGIALDLERELTEDTTSRYTWIEQEERRRVWWAIIIIERSGNIPSGK
jgi:Fungal specific transcription factor domain